MIRQYYFRYLLLLSFIILSTAALGQSPLDTFSGNSWKGSGTLMGSPAMFEMDWQWELDGKFLKLEFQNSRENADGEKIILKAHAYYNPNNDKLFAGTWFDSRGITFPVQGSINGNQFIVEWGSTETEQGRTVYTLKTPEKIEVTDFILQNGDFVKFGEASYVREDEQ